MHHGGNQSLDNLKNAITLSCPCKHVDQARTLVTVAVRERPRSQGIGEGRILTFHSILLLSSTFTTMCMYLLHPYMRRVAASINIYFHN